MADGGEDVTAQRLAGKCLLKVYFHRVIIAVGERCWPANK
jgi:hypothetical protein